MKSTVPTANTSNSGFEPAAADQTHGLGPMHASGQIAAGHSSRITVAQRALLSALVCGVIADQLFRRAAAGVYLSTYLAVAILTTGLVVKQHLGMVPLLAKRFLQIAMLFTLFVSIRDSELLTFLNAVSAATAVAFAMAVVVAATSPTFLFRLARVRDVVIAMLMTARNSALGGFGFLYYDAGKALAVVPIQRSTTRIVVRGVLLALLLVILFGALLSSGDPVFARAISLPTGWEFKPIANHVFMTGLFAWPVLGMQWASTQGVASSPFHPLSVLNADRRMLNRVDVLSIMTAMNVLFAAFVLVQLRVLFGGASYVQATTGLTIAEYARSGFFTLFATGGLVLLTLTVIDATSTDGSIATWKVSRRLSFSLLLFVSLMLVSAATRMTLYVKAFGASVERFYCFGLMAWLAFTLLLFARTVLRHQPRGFVSGAVISAWVTVLAFNLLNVESLVVRTNMARFERGERLDLAYALSLNADAVPTLVEGIVATPLNAVARMDVVIPSAAIEGAPSGAANGTTPPQACSAITKLVEDWTASSSPPNGSWTLSAWRAKKAVTRHANALRLRSCPTTTTPAAILPMATPAAASPST